MNDNVLVADTVNPAEEKAEKQPEAAEPKKEPKTFTRDELNKYIAIESDKARKAEREKVLSEIKAQNDEAARLAAMTEAEKQKELLKQANDRAESAEAQLNSYLLKEQAIKDNKDLPIELINLIDFTKANTAEKVLEQVNAIRSVYNVSLEKGVNNALKEKAPKTVSPDAGNARPMTLSEALADRFMKK